MQLIMANPTERDMIRMRQDVQNDWITVLNSEVRDGQIQVLTNLVKRKRISAEEAANELNMSIKEFYMRSGLKENFT